jgi:hypothetical protein
MFVTTKTVLDHRVDFHVDSQGQFYATEGQDLKRLATGESLKQVVRAVRQEFRKEQIRVAVPFTLLQRDGKLYPALARGFHARDQYKLLVWVDDGSPDGKNDQVESWSGDKFLIPEIPPKDIARIQKLFQRKVKLSELTIECNRLIEEWQQSHTFDLRGATQKAIEEASLTEPDEPEEPQSPVSMDESEGVDVLDLDQ